MKAVDVKRALRGRHPALNEFGAAGRWTCIEEWLNIDLLAVSAWQGARDQPSYARVGYEVKVSRADYRRELARPYKRTPAVSFCHEFYFAVPFRLLHAEELRWVPPLGLDEEPSPLDRPHCPGTHGASCLAGLVRFGHSREAATEHLRRRGFGRTYVGPCPTCHGLGYQQESPAVRAGAPYLWIPSDVGLVVVDDSGKATVWKRAPRRDPKFRMTDRLLGDLIRWVSVRPDPRHADARAARAVA